MLKCHRGRRTALHSRKHIGIAVAIYRPEAGMSTDRSSRCRCIFVHMGCMVWGELIETLLFGSLQAPSRSVGVPAAELVIIME